MDDQEKLRRQFAKYVMMRSAVDKSFLAGVRTSDTVDTAGNTVVVSLLGTDTLLRATELVAQSGGRGVVVVLDVDTLADRSLNIGIAQLKVCRRSGEGETRVPFSPKTTMADLFRIAVAGLKIDLRLDHEAFVLENVEETEVSSKELVLA